MSNMNEDNQNGSNKNKKIIEGNSEEPATSVHGEKNLTELQSVGHLQVGAFGSPFSNSNPMQQISTDGNHTSAKSNTIQDSKYTVKKRRIDKSSNENLEILESDKKLLTQDLSKNNQIQKQSISSASFSRMSKTSGTDSEYLHYPSHMDDTGEVSKYCSEPNRVMTKYCNETSEIIGSEDQSDKEFQDATLGVPISQTETNTSKIMNSEEQKLQIDKKYQEATLGLSCSQTETQIRDTPIIHDNSYGMDRDKASQYRSDKFEENDGAIPGPSGYLEFSVKPDLSTEKRNQTKILSGDGSGESSETVSSPSNDNPTLTALLAGQTIYEILKDPTLYVGAQDAAELMKCKDTGVPLNKLLDYFMGLIINEREISGSQLIGNTHNATNINPVSSGNSTGTSPNLAAVTEANKGNEQTNQSEMNNVEIKHEGVPTAYIQEARQSNLKHCQLYENGKDNLNDVTIDNVPEDKDHGPSETIESDDSDTDTISNYSGSSEISLISGSTSFTLTEESPKYDDDLELDTRKVLIKRPGSPIENEPNSKKRKFNNWQVDEEEISLSNYAKLHNLFKDKDTGPSQSKENDEVFLEQPTLKTTDSSTVLGEEAANNDIPDENPAEEINKPGFPDEN